MSEIIDEIGDGDGLSGGHPKDVAKKGAKKAAKSATKLMMNVPKLPFYIEDHIDEIVEAEIDLIFSELE